MRGVDSCANGSCGSWEGVAMAGRDVGRVLQTTGLSA
jgi:hypothetical protein